MIKEHHLTQLMQIAKKTIRVLSRNNIPTTKRGKEKFLFNRRT